METIYALVDEWGGPRYVGQTTLTLAQRLARHLASSRSRHRELDRWVRSCPGVSIVPLEVNPRDADEAERRWIRNMRTGGINLLNRSDGGRRAATGLRHTAETRARLSEARRGKPLSAEHRRKLSAAHRGVALSEEHREAIGRGGKGRIVTPEQRENMARVKRGQANPMSRTNRAKRGG